MRVNLYLAVLVENGPLEVNYQKSGEALATVELEVVPGGTYEIDGVPYKQVGRPTFHIAKLPSLYTSESRSHHLQTVDLLVVKV